MLPNSRKSMMCSRAESRYKVAMKSMRLLARLIFATLFVTALCNTRALAQGPYVPLIPPPADEFPANLDGPYISYSLTIFTNLPPTPQHLRMIENRRFPLQLEIATGTGGLKWASNTGAIPGVFITTDSANPRIVLSFAFGNNPDLPSELFGPALKINYLRITREPLPDEEFLEIPFDRIEIRYNRVKPDLDTFAAYLNADKFDPEIIDHYRRCPPSSEIVSTFSHFPDGTAIRTGGLSLYKAGRMDADSRMNTDARYYDSGNNRNAGLHPNHLALGERYFAGDPGNWFPAGGLLYEDSLKASLDLGAVQTKPGATAPDGLDIHRRGELKIINGLPHYPVRFKGADVIKGSNIIIGYYYHVFDGLGSHTVQTKAEEVTTTISISRSSYASTMRSSTSTVGLEVAVNAKGGLKDVFEIGGSVKMSTSLSDTNGQTAGEGTQETVEVQTKFPSYFTPGTLTVVEFPVLANATRWGNSRFTFGGDEKLSIGGTARLQEYSIHKGRLRKFISDTDPEDATITTYGLGEEISGVDRSVVLAMFPNLEKLTTNNVFAGRWRDTDISNGEISYLTVTSDGTVMNDAEEPTVKIEETGDGKATLTWLKENKTAEINFKVMERQTDSTFGIASKILFSLGGERSNFWIRAGR